jgi:HK97 gp10 family phage protein
MLEGRLKVLKGFDELLFTVAMDIREGARRRCPVDTGRMKNSIKVSKIHNGYRISVGVDYAKYVEYGTQPMVKAHGAHDPEQPVEAWKAKKNRGGTGQTMPFFRPAVYETINKLETGGVLLGR